MNISHWEYHWGVSGHHTVLTFRILPQRPSAAPQICNCWNTMTSVEMPVMCWLWEGSNAYSPAPLALRRGRKADRVWSKTFLYISDASFGGGGMVGCCWLVCCFWKALYLSLVQEPVKCAFSNYFSGIKQTAVRTREWTPFWKQFLWSICCLEQNIINLLFLFY